MALTNRTQMKYNGEERYAVWTSDSAGDLFRANRVEVNEKVIQFLLYTGSATILIKEYPLPNFVKYNSLEKFLKV